MNIDRVVDLIPSVIMSLKEEYAFKNAVIKDGIFKLLEKHCTVVYYPLQNEKNRGFHIKRFVKDAREDFVYINTAKPLAEQVFTAAHELGHVWNIVQKIQERMPGESFDGEDEEILINRFAAELLMPADEFRRSFYMHLKEMEPNSQAIKLENLIKITVLQMNDFMVPYEAVRRRFVETQIMSEQVAKVMDKNKKVILKLIEVFSQDQNTLLDSVTEKKAIPGLRAMLDKIEKEKLLDEYSICAIKKDFDMDSVSGSLDEVINLNMGDNKANGEN